MWRKTAIIEHFSVYGSEASGVRCSNCMFRLLPCVLTCLYLLCSRPQQWWKRRQSCISQNGDIDCRQFEFITLFIITFLQILGPTATRPGRISCRPDHYFSHPDWFSTFHSTGIHRARMRSGRSNVSSVNAGPWRPLKWAKSDGLLVRPCLKARHPVAYGCSLIRIGSALLNSGDS